MRALHVVSVDLQLGLRLHTSRRREQEVAVVLIGLRLLRVLRYEDTPREDTTAIVTQHVLEELIRGTVRYSMLDVGEVVRMGLPCGEDEARDLEVGTLFGERNEVVITRHTIAQRDTAEVDDAILHLTDIERGDTHIRLGRLLTLDEREAGTAPDVDLDSTQRHSTLRRLGAVTEVERRLSVILKDDECTLYGDMTHQTWQDIAQLDVTRDLCATRHVDDERLGSEESIQRDKPVSSDGRDTAVVLLRQLGMQAYEVRERTDEDLRCEGLRCPVRSTIQHVELPVLGEEAGQVGTLVVLALEAGYPQASEGVISRLAVVIE